MGGGELVGGGGGSCVPDLCPKVQPGGNTAPTCGREGGGGEGRGGGGGGPKGVENRISDRMLSLLGGVSLRRRTK